MSIASHIGTLLHETLSIHNETGQYLGTFENTVTYALDEVEAGRYVEAEAIFRFAQAMSRPMHLLLGHDHSAAIGVVKDGKPEFFK